MASGKVGKKPKDNFCQRMDIIHQNSSKGSKCSLILFAILPLQMEFSWNFTTGGSIQGFPSFAAPNIEQQHLGPPTAKPATPMPKTWVETHDKIWINWIPKNYGLASRLPWL